MLTVHFDGLCQPKNPGGVAIYAFLIERDGKLLHESYGVAAEPGTPQSTNNVAEVTGVLKALEWLSSQEHEKEETLIRGDSELVIRQLTGEYKVKSPNLAPLHAHIRKLITRFSSLRFEWVPRERNKEADALTNLGYAEYRSNHPDI